MTDGRPLIEIRNLRKDFAVRGGVLQRTVANVRAVDDVSLDIYRGEALGLVGESGCGKSTMGRMLVRLLEPTDGTILFEGKDIAHLGIGPRSPWGRWLWWFPGWWVWRIWQWFQGRSGRKELKEFRKNMQIIFQDPFSSLDPRTPVGNSITEGLKVHGVGDASGRQVRLQELLRLVGLESYHARRFPHEFSGGQRQRIGIARSLILNPTFIVADEPVSALDVSVQAQVLNLLKDLQEELDLTLLFIAHNLAVVEHISDRVAVMYLGRIVEVTDRETLYTQAKHPYTQALLSAIPVPDPSLKRSRVVLQGEVPSPLNPPSGCHFHPRCPIAVDGLCDFEVPPLREAEGEPGHLAACHLRTGDHRHLDPSAGMVGGR